MPPAAATASAAVPRQHGVKGVYYGGDWLDLEECDGKFSGVEKDCSGCLGSSKTTHPCPRSKSGNKASDNGVDYDVCIVGAGCIGAAIARELSKYQLRILWLEAADDVSQGATKGNSGIVHAGYDDEPGTNRAKYCWPGNQMFPELDRDLRFGYQTNGSLVVATNPDTDRAILQELLDRGKTNGVERLRIVERKELLEMEPHIHPDAIAALYAPDAGNVIPYVSHQ
jgi:glycerol-3-phosphate dehydrogenase